MPTSAGIITIIAITHQPRAFTLGLRFTDGILTRTTGAIRNMEVPTVHMDRLTTAATRSTEADTDMALRTTVGFTAVTRRLELRWAAATTIATTIITTINLRIC